MRSELLMGDLFCGAGGLSVGFRQAGYRSVFANDINGDCERTYKHNHPDTTFLPGSIEDLGVKGICKATGLTSGDIDVLVGGPPCQGFSINAPKREEKDRRNHLFHEYARLVLEGLRPKVVL